MASPNIKRLGYFVTVEGDKRIGEIVEKSGVARAALLEALIWGLSDESLIAAAQLGEKTRKKHLEETKAARKQVTRELSKQLSGMKPEEIAKLIALMKSKND